MRQTMRGVMYLGPGRLELREVPLPMPGPDEILVQVRAALTCGTDAKTYRRGHPRFPPPFLFGHEFAGDVAYYAFELLASGVVDTQPLISGVLPLERVEEALKLMIEGQVVKMAIVPGMASG